MFSNPFRRLSQLKELLNTLDQHFADTKLSSALFEQNESISQFFVFTSVSSMQDDSLFNANDFSPKTHRVNFINIRKIMMFFLHNHFKGQCLYMALRIMVHSTMDGCLKVCFPFYGVK